MNELFDISNLIYLVIGVAGWIVGNSGLLQALAEKLKKKPVQSEALTKEDCKKIFQEFLTEKENVPPVESNCTGCRYPGPGPAA